MTHLTSEQGVRGSHARRTRYIIGILLVVTISTLNAMVDAVLHPDIPFFDDEHLIVGGISGCVSGVLVVLVLFYLRHLEKAVERIRALESILPLCMYCKRTRRPGADPDLRDSWLPLETYICESTQTQFSHGVCPDCLPKLLSGVAESKYGRATPNQPKAGTGK